MTTQVLTYLGNKRALLGTIGEAVRPVLRELGRSKISFFDAFAGSGIVSRFMKRQATLIIANDLERYSEIVSRCYLSNRSSAAVRKLDEAFGALADYVRTHRVTGPVSTYYAPADDTAIRPGERAFFTHENALFIDTVRSGVDAVMPPECFDLAMGPILAAASVHANTSGVFKGFYKNREGVGAFGGAGRHALSRICAPITLARPVLSVYECESRVLRGDANDVVGTLPEVDLAYVDPPYNQHPYGSNYFLLNVIAENRAPEAASRVSGIPRDWNRSRYNRRSEAEAALFDLLARIPAKYLMVSYNSEGFVSRETFRRRLAELGEVSFVATEYNVFRGSRNLRSRSPKVTEYLFTVKRK